MKSMIWLKKLESHYENRISLQANFREETPHVDPQGGADKPGANFGFTPPDKFRRENRRKPAKHDGHRWQTDDHLLPQSQKRLSATIWTSGPNSKNSLQAITAGLNFQRLADYYNIEGTQRRQETIE